MEAEVGWNQKIHWASSRKERWGKDVMRSIAIQAQSNWQVSLWELLASWKRLRQMPLRPQACWTATLNKLINRNPSQSKHERFQHHQVQIYQTRLRWRWVAWPTAFFQTQAAPQLVVIWRSGFRSLQPEQLRTHKNVYLKALCLIWLNLIRFTFLRYCTML